MKILYNNFAMLQLSPTIINQQVLSLRTNGVVGVTTDPIINPNNLKIEGFYCDDKFSGEKLVLLTQDIRDHIAKGFVIDDHEVLVEPEELIRLKDVLELDFKIIGKPVYTEHKKRVGKVEDYAVDDSSMYVQKLYVIQKLLKSISGGQLSIDRNQIVEITDRKIVVKDPTVTVSDVATSAVPA